MERRYVRVRVSWTKERKRTGEDHKPKSAWQSVRPLQYNNDCVRSKILKSRTHNFSIFYLLFVGRRMWTKHSALNINKIFRNNIENTHLYSNNFDLRVHGTLRNYQISTVNFVSYPYSNKNSRTRDMEPNISVYWHGVRQIARDTLNG